MNEFEQILANVINRNSEENISNTPDFILAKYLSSCLLAFNAAINSRSEWYGRHDSPGSSTAVEYKEVARFLEKAGLPLSAEQLKAFDGQSRSVQRKK
jgi:hypothetical protein